VVSQQGKRDAPWQGSMKQKRMLSQAVDPSIQTDD
jgi:hypothetical protein